MKYIGIAVTLILFMLSVSCKKESQKPEFEDKPVIESYLLAGTVAKVNVSRLIAFASDAQFSSDNMDNLSVTISDGSGTYSLQAMGSGSYAANSSSLVLKEGSTYSLGLFYNDKNVSAVTVIPTKPTGFTESVSTMSIAPRHSGRGGGFGGGSTDPDALKLTWNNSDNSYYLVLVEAIDPNSKLIDTTAGAQPRAFRSSPNQSNTSMVQARQFQYYGMHRLILYHLNPDYANLYGNANNNSTNLTNSSTGVVNGAGIFTGINADTLLINILQL